MTEEEELQAALEASKRESEKAKSTSSPWSSVARPASPAAPKTQPAPVVINGSTATNNAAKPKPTGAEKASATLPSRPPNNPWGLGVPSASTAASTPPIESFTQSTSVPSMPSKSSNATMAHTPESAAQDATPSSEAYYSMHSQSETSQSPLDSLSEDDEDMPMVPLPSAAVKSVPTANRTISRPSDPEPMSSSDLHNKFAASVLEDDTAPTLKTHAPSMGLFPTAELLASASLSTSTHSSGLSSPVGTIFAQVPNQINAATVQQLQETLAAALQRISKLEQANEFLTTRMAQIIDASLQLEQRVIITASTNTSLQAQVQELRTTLNALVQPSLVSSNPDSGMYSSAYSPFFSGQPSFAPPSQRPATSGSVHPIGFPMPASIVSMPPGSVNLLTPQSIGSQGINSSGFAQNGAFVP